MKVLRHTFLYLIIYVLNSTFVNAQNIGLKINGKDSTETHVIDSLNFKTKFIDYASLKKEVDSSFLRLQQKGYIESEVISIDRKNDSLYVAEFHLNNKYDSIYINYNNKHITSEWLEKVSIHYTKEYFSIPISKSESALNYLTNKVSEKGLPFAAFKLENITKRNNTDLQGELILNSAKSRVVNNIIIKGYEKFPKSYLKRYLKIRENQPFNITEIKKKTDGLKNLPFAKQLKDPEILFTKDSTTLYLYLDKNKSNTFDGFLGFGNNETTNKIEFNGYLNLNLINNLNFGETFSLVYKSDENEQRTFNINTSLPYLFKSPLGLNLDLDIFKKDSTYTIVNQSAKLFYQLNRKNKVYGGITLTNSNNLLNSSSDLVKDYNSTFITTSFEHSNTTDDYLFPLQSYFFLQTNIGKRELDNKKENQTSINFKSFKIFNLNNKNSIYINVTGETMFSDNYFENELKRFGGINSIRGFEENSLFATLYSVINSEYRYLLNNNIYAHTIIDAAYYEDDINKTKEKLFGFGFGFGLITKAGLFKLNYANGLSENQPFKINNSKIHISLNAFF